MAVDYDGSSSTYASSANYTIAEYVGDIVDALTTVCEETDTPHPTIVTENGRALVAYQSALIFEVLGVTRPVEQTVPKELPDDAHNVMHSLLESYETLSAKNYQEAYHDILHHRDEAMSLFKLGYLTIEDCGRMRKLHRRS